METAMSMNAASKGVVRVGALATADGLTQQTQRSYVGGAGNAPLTDIIITNAQLLALFTTPITIVPAPGVGKALVFEGAALWYVYGSAAFTVGSASYFAIKPTNASGTAWGGVAPTGFVDQTSSQVRFMRPYNAASGESGVTPVDNAPLVLHQLTANLTGGTGGVLRIRVLYRVIPTTF
jgi:hypothetical protein